MKILDHRGNEIEKERPQKQALISKGKKYAVGLAVLMAFLAGLTANYKTIYEVIFSSNKVSYSLSIDTVRDNSSGGPRVLKITSCFLMNFMNRNTLILHVHAYSFSNLLILLIPSGASV